MILKSTITIPVLSGKTPRRLYVYLPPEYRKSSRSYPVLYMFDGHNVFFDRDATYGKSWGMSQYLKKENPALIVVAVECNHKGNRRLCEYSPWSFEDERFGSVDSVADMAAQCGVQNSAPMAKLKELIDKTVAQGRKVHFLPPYRHDLMIQLMDLTGIHPSEQRAKASLELIMAVIDQRAVKSAEEIEALERAFQLGYAMHTTAMKMCKAGVVEREIAGAMEGIAKAKGLGVSFGSIVSQHGETLHNLNSDGVLENGRLLLVDAGAESLENYCSDHTRTYPVSGKFTQKQKDIYNIVLKAHDDAAAALRPGMMYMELSDVAQKLYTRDLYSRD